MSHRFRAVCLALCLATVSCLVARESFADQPTTNGFAESDFIFGGQRLVMIHALQLNREFDRHWGVFAFGAVSENFGEVYGGPRVKPTDWLTLSLGGGMQDNRDFRASGSLLLAGRGLTLFAMGEANKSRDLWFQAIASCKVASVFSTGAFTQRFVGVGPYLEVDRPFDWPLTVWASPVSWDWEDAQHRAKHTVGIRASF